MYSAPRFLDCGEAALSVEFGDAVDPAINARVLALDAALRAAPPPGLRETTPTYRALFVRYEPMELSRAALIARVVEAMRLAPLAPPTRLATRWILPCCYDPSLAEDIVEAAALLKLSIQALAQMHAATEHRAYMYGFAPGWLYLGEAPPELRIPRRAQPRGPTPRGAVLIGGGLSLIGADPMPTGWYVVARTPARLFSPTSEPPCFIAPGDDIRFDAVDAATFASLASRVDAGEIVARKEDA